MFKGARLKVERVDHHIANLERELIAFARKILDASVREATGGKVDITITILETPPGIPLMIGDAVHNLRTALDHMTWELVERDQGKQDRYLKFPTGDNKINFEATCNGIKTPSQSVRDAFRALEAFPGGKGERLYALSDLDNADKHTILIPTINAPRMSDLVLVVEGARRCLADLYGHDAAFGHGETLTIDGAPNGVRLELKGNARGGRLVVFGKIGSLQRVPVLPMLLQFRHAVENVIDAIAGSITR